MATVTGYTAARMKEIEDKAQQRLKEIEKECMRPKNEFLQEEIKIKEFKIKQRESKINFIKSHLFCNITVEQMWKFHDFIQLYYDDKCHLTDYDNKLDELVRDIKQGKYSKI